MELKDKISKAYTKARQTFNKTYTNICTIKIYKKEIINGLTKTFLKPIYENRPCLLQTRNRNGKSINQDIYGKNMMEWVLMLEYQIEPIPDNCFVEVIKNGIKYNFKNAKCLNLDTHTLLLLKENKEKT